MDDRPRPPKRKTVKGPYGPPVEKDSEHYVLCPECGFWFDRRDRSQIAHHEDAGHKPAGLRNDP